MLTNGFSRNICKDVYTGADLGGVSWFPEPPPFAILIIFWIVVYDSKREIVVFLFFYCNAERKLYDPKAFSGLRNV